MIPKVETRSGVRTSTKQQRVPRGIRQSMHTPYNPSYPLLSSQA